jgi:hypothetical protein
MPKIEAFVKRGARRARRPPHTYVTMDVTDRTALLPEWLHCCLVGAVQFLQVVHGGDVGRQ